MSKKDKKIQTDQRDIIFPRYVLDAKDAIHAMGKYLEYKNFNIQPVTENEELKVNCSDCYYYTPDKFSPLSVIGDCHFSKDRNNSYAFKLNDYCVDFIKTKKRCED